jgi:hypothetical protein
MALETSAARRGDTRERERLFDDDGAERSARRVRAT